MNRAARFLTIFGLFLGVFVSQVASQAPASNTWTVAGHLTQARTGAAAVLLTTFGLTLVRDLTTGIIAGCVLAAVFFLLRRPVAEEGD